MNSELLKRLADEYAHVYSFVGDDTMPLKRKELHDAISATAETVAAYEREVAMLRALLNKLEYNEFGAKRFPTEQDVDAELSAMKQRAEAAEARIKASQGQKPVGCIKVSPNGQYSFSQGEPSYLCKQTAMSTFYVYSAPVIPPYEREVDANAKLKLVTWLYECGYLTKEAEELFKAGNSAITKEK